MSNPLMDVLGRMNIGGRASSFFDATGHGRPVVDGLMASGVFRPPLAPQLMSASAAAAPRKQGLAGIIQGLGDRAAKSLYGDQAGQMRDQVWGDVLGGIGARMSAGGSLGQGINDARLAARESIADQFSAEQRRRAIALSQPPSRILNTHDTASKPKRKTLSEMTYTP